MEQGVPYSKCFAEKSPAVQNFLQNKGITPGSYLLGQDYLEELLAETYQTVAANAVTDKYLEQVLEEVWGFGYFDVLLAALKTKTTTSSLSSKGHHAYMYD